MKQFFLLVYACTLFACATTQAQKEREIWSREKATAWYSTKGWLRGSNYIPASAINQLEMWQAATFEPITIDRELGYAEAIGFNLMRVFLHHAAWEADAEGFKKRVREYLAIADKHHIQTMFVFFDDCWNESYTAGTQSAPKPGIHNSGWVKDPGKLYYDDPSLISTLEKYVKDILTTFADDNRILVWDLYNEPGNGGYGNKSMVLLSKVFSWARQVNPVQPLSVGVWDKNLTDLNRYQLQQSDIITYHNYNDENEHKKVIDSLSAYGRPLICTEYMARTRGSYFKNIMPLLKANNVGAINWGFVSGKTNTIYAWDTPMPDGDEPKTWFHDIFRKDGTPYSEQEIQLIKSLTGK